MYHSSLSAANSTVSRMLIEPFFIYHLEDFQAHILGQKDPFAAAN